MLHFIYGTMGSGKTLDLLKMRYNYIESNLNTLTIVSCDERGTKEISSRAMRESVEPDLYISEEDDLYKELENSEILIDGIFVDEVQFLTIEQIHQLRHYANQHPYCEIYCYGLLTTTDNEMWEASKELLLLAHDKNEIHSRCQKCGKRYASHHLKTKNGKWNDKSQYQSVCYECWLSENK